MIVSSMNNIHKNTIVKDKYGDLYYVAQRVGKKYENFFTLINLNTGWAKLEANEKDLISMGYKTVGTSLVYKFVNKNRDTTALPILLGDFTRICNKLCWVCTHNNKVIIIVMKTGYYLVGDKNIPETLQDKYKLLCKNSNMKLEYSLTS